MRRVPALLLALAAALPVAADFRYSAAKVQFYLPGPAWSLALPREDWFIAQERVKADGSGVYYVASSPARGVHLSVVLTRTEDCTSGATCREFWKRNIGDALAKVSEISEYDRNGFSVVEFTLDKPQGLDVVQVNAWGHAYRDGHWVDVHLSRVGKTRPDPKELQAVLDTILVGAKALDGPRHYVVPGSRNYVMDVPQDWRDAMGAGELPTVTFKPPRGDGFEVVVSMIPPRKPDSPVPSREEALGHVKHAITKILETSVEKQIEPREMKGKAAWGYVFGATDREPGTGYKYMRQGFVVTGNQMLFVTVLFRAGEERNAERALEMALSVRGAS